MKYATLALLGIGLAIGTSLAQGQAPAAKGEPELKTVEQKFAYAYGISFGRSMKQQGVALDPDLLAKGIKDGLADKSIFTDQQLVEIQQAFQKTMMEAEAKKQAAAGPLNEKNLKDGQAFLDANKSKPGVKTTASGLQYKVLKAGTGKSPKLTDSVEANYRGTLIDGTEFDSSAKSGGPITFGVTEVIKGWTEVLQLMKEGDKWLVYIPSELAYGPRARGAVIKANSALIFEMELVKVVSEK
jgi:FKBP-type peptidyl-prolyl cis-trans isomerase FklB